MAESAWDAIKAFRRSHDETARQVADFGPDQLRAGSGAAEWTVAQVLSHLGSSSEIALDTLTARAANREGNQAVWDRWNAMAPAQQAAGFVAWEERLAEALEALTNQELAGLRLDLGFLPWPVDIGMFTEMRLSEVTLHRWDVDVAFDPQARQAGPRTHSGRRDRRRTAQPGRSPEGLSWLLTVGSSRDGHLSGAVRGSHAWGSRTSGAGRRVLLPL